MSLSTFSGDFIDTALSQLGASRIKVVSGKQHVVDFDLGEGLTLTYIFTITNENRCYLQRARPYPMVQGRLARGPIDRAHGRNPCPFPRGLL